MTSLPKWFKLKANDDDMVFDRPIPTCGACDANAGCSLSVSDTFHVHTAHAAKMQSRISGEYGRGAADKKQRNGVGRFNQTPGSPPAGGKVRARQWDGEKDFALTDGPKKK